MLLWKCCLRAHHNDDALAAFKSAQEILKDNQEDQYKEFVQFFTTAISQKGKVSVYFLFQFRS